jgi:phosphatidylserine decarboxylase
MVKIFCQNKREYVTISTKNFGDVIMTEVGATMVGSIVQTYEGNTAWKGGEKGFFKFGGSSIVLIFEKNKILIDDDLIKNTKRNLETSILMGERVAAGVHVYSNKPVTTNRRDQIKEKTLSKSLELDN